MGRKRTTAVSTTPTPRRRSNGGTPTPAPATQLPVTSPRQWTPEQMQAARDLIRIFTRGLDPECVAAYANRQAQVLPKTDQLVTRE